jgi:aspartate kinase
VDADVLTEMAIFGAAVVHPRAAELAATRGVDLHVSNSFTSSVGTVVRSRVHDSIETGGCVIAVTDDRSFAQVRIHNRTMDPHRELFTVLAAHAVAVDLVGHVDGGITFAVPRDDVAAVHAMLTTDGTISAAEIEVDDSVGKVSLVGRGLLSNMGYVSRALATLADLGISARSLSSSQSRISVLVPADQMVDAVKALHREFRLSTGDQTLESMVPA